MPVKSIPIIIAKLPTYVLGVVLFITAVGMLLIPSNLIGLVEGLLFLIVSVLLFIRPKIGYILLFIILLYGFADLIINHRGMVRL